MPLQEDARALDVLRGVDAGALERLVADRVDPNGPGAKAGIKRDDQLVSGNGQEIKRTPGLVRQLYNTGVWSKATYSPKRSNSPRIMRS